MSIFAIIRIDTPLYKASENEHTEIVKYLVEHGAEIVK
jgi:ankyrin repeat protein